MSVALNITTDKVDDIFPLEVHLRKSLTLQAAKVDRSLEGSGVVKVALKMQPIGGARGPMLAT